MDKPGHRLFFDCATADAARVLVTELDFGLWRAADAFVSMALPVTLEFPVWDNTVAAKLRWIADEDALLKTRPAVEATLVPVDLFAITFSNKIDEISTILQK